MISPTQQKLEKLCRKLANSEVEYIDMDYAISIFPTISTNSWSAFFRVYENVKKQPPFNQVKVVTIPITKDKHTSLTKVFVKNETDLIIMNSEHRESTKLAQTIIKLMRSNRLEYASKDNLGAQYGDISRSLWAWAVKEFEQRANESPYNEFEVRTITNKSKSKVKAIFSKKPIRDWLELGDFEKKIVENENQTGKVIEKDPVIKENRMIKYNENDIVVSENHVDKEWEANNLMNSSERHRELEGILTAIFPFIIEPEKEETVHDITRDICDLNGFFSMVTIKDADSSSLAKMILSLSMENYDIVQTRAERFHNLAERKKIKIIDRELYYLLKGHPHREWFFDMYLRSNKEHALVKDVVKAYEEIFTKFEVKVKKALENTDYHYQTVMAIGCSTIDPANIFGKSQVEDVIGEINGYLGKCGLKIEHTNDIYFFKKI